MKIDLPFNPAPSTILHIDLNSAFASIEQLCDPHLRGKPIAVAAYVSPRGCIVAPSIEAKRFGVKVGMRVQEGKRLCRDLVVLAPDPNKYRAVHVQMKKLLSDYTDGLTPKSIDEFILDMERFPTGAQGLHGIANEIKARIRAEVGESLTVSIGLAPNRFLAKMAAQLRKPDGLDEINLHNHPEIFSRWKLMDLTGIKQNNCVRLNQRGIYTVTDFYRASAQELQSAFESVVGYYWYLRLRGWEPDAVLFGRHSFGNSFALPTEISAPEELAPILMKLVEKTGYRMRKAGYKCRGVHVALLYADGSNWHRGITFQPLLFDSRDLYKLAFEIMCAAPHRKPVRILAESVFHLQKAGTQQMSLFGDTEKKQRLINALDAINERWGNFIITPARMLDARELVPDRISFGSVRELEEMIVG